MSNDELLDEFVRYLDDVLNQNKVTLSIKKKTAATPVVAAHLEGFVVRAQRFLHLNPQQRKQKTVDVVESYAESHTLQEMTREDYCSLESGFERDALEIFFGFLQILQATR